MGKEIVQDRARTEICPHPIFVIGSPRSGTTILASSLAQHSQLWTSAESHFLFELFGQGRVEREFQRLIARPSQTWLRIQGVEREEFLRYLGLGFNALFSSRSMEKRWIDHTPHHALMVDLLADLFPGAFFLHILRDGRRVVHSMLNVRSTLSDRERSDMEKGGFLPLWTRNFKDSCKSWHQGVEASMDFCKKHPDRCMTVVNEELVADPENGFRRIFQFLRVPYEEATVNFFRSNRINSSLQSGSADPSRAQRLSAPWNKWTLDQKRNFLEEAGATLIKYGLATTDELKLSDYDQLVLRIREVVSGALPPGATVIVVSKGDEELLKLDEIRAWHFPRYEDGVYAGYYPLLTALSPLPTWRRCVQTVENSCSSRVLLCGGLSTTWN